MQRVISILFERDFLENPLATIVASMSSALQNNPDQQLIKRKTSLKGFLMINIFF